MLWSQHCQDCWAPLGVVKWCCVHVAGPTPGEDDGKRGEKGKQKAHPLSMGTCLQKRQKEERLCLLMFYSHMHVSQGRPWGAPEHKPCLSTRNKLSTARLFSWGGKRCIPRHTGWLYFQGSTQDLWVWVWGDTSRGIPDRVSAGISGPDRWCWGRTSSGQGLIP